MLPRGDEMGHRQQEDWKSKRAPNPESSCHAPQFAVVLFGIRHHRLWFERHAADRTASRTILLNLRVHGTGVDRFCGCFISRIALQGHSTPGAITWLV